MDQRFGWIAAAVVGLAGCQVGSEDSDDGGQSGTAMPDGCYEDHRVVLTDVDAVPDGFDQSPADAMALVEGDWTGTGTLASGDTLDATFSVAWDGGEVQAVYFVFRGGGGEGMGAPASSASSAGTGGTACAPSYAFGVVTSLDASPWVAGEGAGPVSFTPVGAPWLSAQTPLEDVTGTLAPSFDPTAWDHTDLQASLSVGEPSMLDLSWQGTNEQGARAATSTATATSTGTIEPSGMSESITSFEVVRG